MGAQQYMGAQQKQFPISPKPGPKRTMLWVDAFTAVASTALVKHHHFCNDLLILAASLRASCSLNEPLI